MRTAEQIIKDLREAEKVEAAAKITVQRFKNELQEVYNYVGAILGKEEPEAREIDYYEGNRG